ncbi:MAG: LON peptidase substrate-binding domain-containing protein [bacterium]|nr:peptidase S16 [Gammaproteobacteria bacterium]HIL96429.1 peptidase S16 [Pseudomonadales bacterium]
MTEIALFPLPLVLFPGGKLPLQIFETRYLDMIKNCMKEDVGFGVILIEEGKQVLRHARQEQPRIADIGTYCAIVDFDQQANGLLQITIEGEVKFSIRHQYENVDRLMLAQVEFLPLEDPSPIPENKHHLVELLETLTRHESVQSLDLTVDFEAADDVSARLTELLPCENNFKQRMLELENPVVRLTELEKQLLRMQDLNR